MGRTDEPEWRWDGQRQTNIPPLSVGDNKATIFCLTSPTHQQTTHSFKLIYGEIRFISFWCQKECFESKLDEQMDSDTVIIEQKWGLCKTMTPNNLEKRSLQK